ncbi:hypothetical protein OG824_13670 [Streptomyces prunicolor]|uniref:hypothetical protein n=1 Tax=Streptomyces prunicolor TaxID=67348 RepID=UPI00225AA4A3|nr:hypothetical protein [Streptomyces prunicolor]MCX5236249.1 hypothetical protein [Streptomyces prunicolor]
MKVELTACDRDGEIPALTYEIKVSDGREISIDLCTRHAAKIEELIGELLDEGGTQAEDESATEPEQVEQTPAATSAPATRAPAKKAPAKKAPAKKAAAKKAAAAKTTSGRRRPRVTTLEEIERQKQQD